MKLRGIYAVLLAGISLLTANSQADTLIQVIERTLETHPEVLFNQYNRLAAEEGIAQAKAGYLPRVQVSGGYGREYSDNATTRLATEDGLELSRRELGINVSQTLFDGFQVNASVDNRKALRNSAAHRALNSSENVAQASAEAFLNIFRRQALLELAKDNLVVHQKNLSKIEELYNAGAGRIADAQQSQSRLALAESVLINAEGNLTNAIIYYQQITGEQPQNLVDFLSDPVAERLKQNLPETLEAAVDYALQHHPTLLTARAEINAAEANYRQAGAAFMPQVTLDVGASKNNNLDGVEGDNDDWQAMLHLNYNVYRGGADRARRAETIQLLAAAREALRQAEREVQQNVHLAWNNLNTVRQRISPLEKHLKATEEVVDSYNEQFKLGQRSLLDVLDSEGELFRARSSLADLKFSEWIEIFNMLGSMGQLLNTLQITPPSAAQLN